MFGSLLLLIFLGLPIVYSFMTVVLGTGLVLWGPAGLLTQLYEVWHSGTNFLLVAVPLFILMGELLLYTGVSKAGFDFLSYLTRPIPGGLAVATVFLCVLVGAITGLTPAATAIVASVVYPELKRQGYNKRFAVGLLPPSCAIDLLIPPSIIMVLYGFLVGVSVGEMFMAGIVPGIMTAVIFSVYTTVRCTLNPKLAPRLANPAVEGEQARGRGFWQQLLGILPFGLLILVVLGTIWGGFATPTESAGIGVVGTLLLALRAGKLNWKNVKNALMATSRMTSMALIILFGAVMFTQILSYSGFVQVISDFVVSLHVPLLALVFLMLLVYYFLGCFMDVPSMLFITIPIYLPIMLRLGIDPLWFGILFVITAELANITPPVGMNLYVMKAIAPDVSLEDIIIGSLPYYLLFTLTLLIVLFFPQLVHWLPNTMIR